MPLASNRLLGSRLLWLIGGRLSLLLFSLFSTGLMTRDLGPHGFGDYRTAVGYLGLIVLLADLGLASIFVREISAPDADQDRLVGNAIALRLTLATCPLPWPWRCCSSCPSPRRPKRAALWAAPGFLAYSLHLMLFGLFQQTNEASRGRPCRDRWRRRAAGRSRGTPRPRCIAGRILRRAQPELSGDLRDRRIFRARARQAQAALRAGGLGSPDTRRQHPWRSGRR